MPTVARAERPRLYLARDAGGRNLFVPWYPLSRTAFVLPGPVERESLRRRLELFLMFWLGVMVGMGVTAVFAGPPVWSGLVVAGLGTLHWLWWSRRQTRGLERTRYEPPPAR